MSDLTSTPHEAPIAPRLALRDRSLILKVLTNPLGVFSAVTVVLFTFIAVFANSLMRYDPGRIDYNALDAPPSAAHWLGADGLGRDMFDRLLIGTRFTLSGALLAVLMAAIIGCSLGLLAGYFGGVWDHLGTWLTSVIQALPGLVVLLAAAAVLGTNLYLAMFIFGFLLSPSFYRLTYVIVRGVRNELYVDAARVAGLGDLRIMLRHILGVVRAPIIIQAGIVTSIAIAIQSGLQFLGFGDVESITWGSMLSEGFKVLGVAPLQLLWPSLTIAWVMIALIIFANTLRDELERVGARVRRATRRSMTDHVKAAAEDAIMHDEPNRKGELLLEVDKLEIGYLQASGKYNVVVHNTTLSVNRGEVVGLVGESGSGKTQTALAILGLLPEGGTILDGKLNFDELNLRTIEGKAYDKLRGRRISYIPQEPMSNLDPNYTVGSQLTERLRVVLGMSKADAKERAMQLLDKVGMPDPEKTFSSYAHEISGGQAQRVLIAAALSCEPDLIIADEPTTALDVTIQAEILELLRDLQKETGVAILLVTHNFGVVADLCDRVVVMQYGRVVESGAILDIFDHPQHPYTKELLGAILDENGPARSAYVAPVAKAGK
jgi:peptide/nickel transport system permease protein